MAGIRSVVYTLHLWPPIAHAKHYTGARESGFGRSSSRRLAVSWLNSRLCHPCRPRADGCKRADGTVVRFGWRGGR